jgi:hypothetical protein
MELAIHKVIKLRSAAMDGCPFDPAIRDDRNGEA